MHSRPPPPTATAEEIAKLDVEKAEKTQRVSLAFMEYLAGTGVFAEMATHRKIWEKTCVSWLYG